MLRKEDFESLATVVGAAHFDLMLVGDGSGQTATEPCGWSCAAYYRPSGRMKAYHGGTSAGTNNFAELIPYIHALWAIDAAAKKSGQTVGMSVLIVSDSELTVHCGSGKYARTANLPLWAAIDEFVRLGYRLTWKHVPRNSNPLSSRADRVAGKLRNLVKGMKE